MTQETEREAFEKAAKLEGLNVARHRIGHDDYDCDNTQWRWLGFKHGLMQARARVGKGEVDRAFDDGARFAIAMKSAKPVEVESAKHDAFIEWFHNPHRTKLEYPYSGDSALAFHAGYDARTTDTELTRLKRQVEVLREGFNKIADENNDDCVHCIANDALAAADRIAKGEV